MHNDIEQILLSQEQLQDKIQELGAQITEDYAGKNPIFIGVLKGVIIFFADIVRAIDTPCEFDFMCIRSYKGTESTGQPIVTQDVSVNLENRHVVILEDIFDTGNSLQFTYDHLLTKHPASLRICTLLDKPSRRKPGITVKPDYIGFSVDDKFVVGYGLDYNEKYRNLPYVGCLKPEFIQK